MDTEYLDESGWLGEYNRQANEAYKNGTLSDFLNDMSLESENGSSPYASEWLNFNSDHYFDLLAQQNNESSDVGEDFNGGTIWSSQKNYISNVGDYGLFLKDDYVDDVTIQFDNISSDVDSKVIAIKNRLAALKDYAATDPTVECSLSADNIDLLKNDINKAIVNAKQTLIKVTSAITNYGTGNWSSVNKKDLESFLGIYNVTSGTGMGTGTGTGSTGGELGINSGNGNNHGNSESDSNNDSSSTDDENVSQDDSNLTDSEIDNSDDKFVIPGGGNLSHKTNNNFDGGNIDDSLLNDENIYDKTNNSIDNSNDLDKLSSSFSIPSPNGDIDGVKKSSSAVPLAVTMAAAAMLGSKVYYDKSHYDDKDEKDDNDDVIDTVDELQEETASDVVQKANSVTDYVDFKNKLLEDMEEENEQ